MPLGGALTLGGIGAGASLFGSKNASNAAQTAAQMQQQSTQQALQFAKQAYNTQQQETAPYRQAGAAALQNLMTQYGAQTPQDFANRSAGYVNAARMNPYGVPFQNQGMPQGGSMANPYGNGVPPGVSPGASFNNVNGQIGPQQQQMQPNLPLRQVY